MYIYPRLVDDHDGVADDDDDASRRATGVCVYIHVHAKGRRIRYTRITWHTHLLYYITEAWDLTILWYTGTYVRV